MCFLKQRTVSLDIYFYQNRGKKKTITPPPNNNNNNNKATNFHIGEVKAPSMAPPYQNNTLPG